MNIKELLKILIINLSIIFVLVVVLEIFARFYYDNAFLLEGNQYLFFQFDEHLGWRGKPNVQGEFKRGEEFDTIVKTNSLGYRDNDYSKTKPKDVFRVAVLGDSFTWGFGVNNEHMFAEVLETELGSGYEVINFGISGFGRGQHLLQLKDEILGFNPDAVIIMSYPGNDLSDNVSDNPEHELYPRPAFSVDTNGKMVMKGHPVKKPPGNFTERFFMRHVGNWMSIYLRSHLFRMVYHAFTSLKKSWENDPSDYLHGYYRVSEKPILEKQAEVEKAILKEFRNELFSRNIKMLVAIATTPEQVRVSMQKEIEKKFPDIEVDWDQPAKLLESSAKLLDIDVINLKDRLKKEEDNNIPVHHKIDFHWNIYGNRLVGESLVPWVQSISAKLNNPSEIVSDKITK